MICRSRRVAVDEEAVKAALRTKLLTEGTELERQIEAHSKEV